MGAPDAELEISGAGGHCQQLRLQGCPGGGGTEVESRSLGEARGLAWDAPRDSEWEHEEVCPFAPKGGSMRRHEEKASGFFQSVGLHFKGMPSAGRRATCVLGTRQVELELVYVQAREFNVIPVRFLLT